MLNFSSFYSNWASSRKLTGLAKRAKKVTAAIPALAGLSDEQVKEQFQALRSQKFDDRVVPGFALVAEAARRALGLTPYEVQIIAGLTILGRQVAEMKTGEGKTLTLVAPACLMALDGLGVHVVTANPYLAQRDAQQMQPVYEMLGLSVGVVQPESPIADKQQAYAADVTYSVNFELGFDFLRDSLASDPALRVQRKRAYAIVDELDSILLDDARTPLIISGLGPDSSEQVRAAWNVARKLTPGTDFHVVEKDHLATLTDQGWASAEAMLRSAGLIHAEGDLYHGAGLALAKRIEAGVRARTLYRKDRDYVVRRGEVILVDRGTGRAMEGRRLEETLHELIEAKEGLQIQPATVSYASVSYQSYFGEYPHLCGLTGTAMTDADELLEIYNLAVVRIPTNKPSRKKYLPDELFPTQGMKLAAAVEAIKEKQQAGQPILVGCSSIREAEALSILLNSAHIEHSLLTAKHVEQEAAIIAQAGAPGAVTVATHMAGRGTDILLGGVKPQADADEAAKQAYEQARARVLALGGLAVLALERNGLRRVDDQLAGRCGRQGDPGEVRFLCSLEDELFKLYAGSKSLEALGGGLGAAAPALVRRIVRKAQERFEQQGFEARKELLKYDSVLNSQRDIFFELRDEANNKEKAPQRCAALVQESLTRWFDSMTTGAYVEEWPLQLLKEQVMKRFNIDAPFLTWVEQEDLEPEEILENLKALAAQRLEAVSAQDAVAVLRSALDYHWKEHMVTLGELRTSSSFAAQTGRNPLYEYQTSAFSAFESFLHSVQDDVADKLTRIESASLEPQQAPEPAQAAEQDKADFAVYREKSKRWIGRNEPCPCGSGLKFKKCHGALP